MVPEAIPTLHFILASFKLAFHFATTGVFEAELVHLLFDPLLLFSLYDKFLAKNFHLKRECNFHTQ